MYNVYIETFNKHLAHDMAYAAHVGCEYDREMEKSRMEGKPRVHYFYWDRDIEKSFPVPVGLNEFGLPPLVVAGIETTEEYFHLCGVEVPKPLHIPPQLRTFAKRRYSVTTFGDVKKSQYTKFPLFIKSYDRQKLFPSGVIQHRGTLKMDSIFNKVPDNTTVLISDYIDMSSEYRAFIRRGEIVGFKHYRGDFRLFPDFDFIDECIKAYTNAPASYCLDFAVSATPLAPAVSRGMITDTVLVEANDMWSLGTYGLDGETYLSCLKARWYEIMKPFIDREKNKRETGRNDKLAEKIENIVAQNPHLYLPKKE